MINFTKYLTKLIFAGGLMIQAGFTMEQQANEIKKPTSLFKHYEGKKYNCIQECKGYKGFFPLNEAVRDLLVEFGFQPFTKDCQDEISNSYDLIKIPSISEAYPIPGDNVCLKISGMFAVFNVKVVGEYLLHNKFKKLAITGLGELAEYLVIPLSYSKTLECLDISRNNSHSKEVCLLANALVNNNSLEVLRMDITEVGDSGAASISKVIRTAHSLHTLSLVQALIGNKGANDLADALQSNSTLVIVDLIGNNIEDEGAQSFAQMLLINRTLRRLELGSNCITYVGVKALNDGIQENNIIEHLGLGNMSSFVKERKHHTVISFHDPACLKAKPFKTDTLDKLKHENLSSRINIT